MCLVRWVLVLAVVCAVFVLLFTGSAHASAPESNRGQESTVEIPAGEAVVFQVCGFPLFVIVHFQDGTVHAFYGASLLMFKGAGQMLIYDWAPDHVCRAIYESQLPGA